MNILYIDDDENLENILMHLNKKENFHVSFCSSFKEFSAIYVNKFDFVIIDFSTNFGNDVLNYIVDTNKEQKIICISNKIGCCIPQRGEYCQNRLNIRRLLRPVDTRELLDLIVNFEEEKCKFKNKLNCKSGILEVMDQVIKRFPFTNYDKENNIINISEQNNKNYTLTIEITNFLNEIGIEFLIEDEHKIKMAYQDDK